MRAVNGQARLHIGPWNHGDSIPNGGRPTDQSHGGI